VFRLFLILPALLFLCWAGLQPMPESGFRLWILPLAPYWTDVLLNAGGFYLFTLLVLPSFPRHAGRILAALFLLVAFFELVQYLCLPFRWATVHDVIYGWTGVSLAALTLHLMTYGHFKIENQKFPTSSTES